MKQKVQPIAQPTWELTHTVKRGFRPCPRTMGIMTVSIREYESAAKSWSAKYTVETMVFGGARAGVAGVAGAVSGASKNPCLPDPGALRVRDPGPGFHGSG